MAWDHHADSARSLKPWLDPSGSGVASLKGLYPGSVQEGKAQVGNYFSLYPNPAGSTLWFSSRTPRQGIVTYRVYDLRGALLMEGNGELSAPVMFDVGSLQSGFYLLLVEYGTVRELLKFVKTR